MNTTVEITDSLLVAARRLAAKEGTSLSVLIEEGLRQVVDKRESRSGFRLRRVTFGGDGLSSDLTVGDWAAIQGRSNEACANR